MNARPNKPYQLKHDLDISELIVATHNKGKWGEFEHYLTDWPCVVRQGDFLVEPEETGDTFIENAILKARAAVTVSQQWCLGDDAGIQIHCLNNFPSVHTKRFAEEQGGWDEAIKVLLERIRQKKSNQKNAIIATYHCALALFGPDGSMYTAEGIATGRIVQGNLLQICQSPERQKSPAIAFEPIFYMDNYQSTYTMMEPMQRIQYHYRHQAIQLLQEQIFA